MSLPWMCMNRDVQTCRKQIDTDRVVNARATLGSFAMLWISLGHLMRVISCMCDTFTVLFQHSVIPFDVLVQIPSESQCLSSH